MMCRIKVKPFLIGSDDSDSDEGNPGRTMATEYELAPLEGAAILPVSFKPCSPSFLLSFPPLMLCLPHLWKSDTANKDLIRSRKLVLFGTLIPTRFRVYVPGTDESTGAEFGRDGQAGATAENEAPPLRGAPCKCGMLLRRLRTGV